MGSDVTITETRESIGISLDFFIGSDGTSEAVIGTMIEDFTLVVLELRVVSSVKEVGIRLIGAFESSTAINNVGKVLGLGIFVCGSDEVDVPALKVGIGLLLGSLLPFKGADEEGTSRSSDGNARVVGLSDRSKLLGLGELEKSKNIVGLSEIVGFCVSSMFTSSEGIAVVVGLSDRITLLRLGEVEMGKKKVGLSELKGFLVLVSPFENVGKELKLGFSV